MGSTSTGLHRRGSSQRTGEVFSRNSRVRGARVARRVISSLPLYANGDQACVPGAKSRLDYVAALACRMPAGLAAVRVRAALGGGIVHFELAAVSTAAQVAPGTPHLGRVAHGARNDSG